MTTKMEALSSGHGVQVVVPEEHTFVLDEEALAALLLREDVRERTAVVVSVAGAFRKGKSFLLDFFLRYLHHKYALCESGGKWLESGDESSPLKGFDWRGGAERNTTGLLLWSQPFKATLETGEKVVILIMDTQGTFDSNSTVKDNATVFALSTMLSSVQIYNLSQNIEEDDLQHLQLFTDYGRLGQDRDDGFKGKPFQKLQLLVRDWSYPYEYEYGAEGGQRLLNRKLEVREDQHEQLQALRSFVKSCFEEITCFLMPHPGLKVATDPNFKGTLSDIDPMFKKYLEELVPMLLAPENLVLKKIGGQKLKAKDLMLYFKAYMKVFNGTEMPEPKTMLEATAEANNLTAVSEAKEVYETLMEEAAGGSKPYLDPRLLDEQHRRARDKALHAFHNKKKMGGKDLSMKYMEQLTQELEEQFDQIRARNEAKNLFNFAVTPGILCLLMVLWYMISMLGHAVGVNALVVLGQGAATACIFTLVFWTYTRATGNMREVGLQIDAFANSIRDNVLQQLKGHSGASAAMAYGGDGKKRP